jgi:Spy/CpxP family protein refolding chaperone
MKSKTVIIILSSIIIIQIIGGIFILNREKELTRNLILSPFGVMHDKPEMGHGKHFFKKGNKFGGNFCEPEFMKEKLSMNQEQVEKITELNKKFDSEFSSYNNLIKPERDKLRGMLKSDENVDLDAVKQQLKKIEDINVEINLLRIKQGNEISKILTPEQMKILRAERKLFFDNMQKHRRSSMEKHND